MREAHLRVGERRRHRKRAAVARVPTAAPQHADERWSMDFVRDTLADGRPLRVWTLVDDCTRECPLLVVDRSLPARRVCEALDALLLVRAAPRTIVCDHGPEFVSLALDQWASAPGVTLDVTRPGHPVDNCFIESFNGRLRDECLNVRHFDALPAARHAIEAWREDDNTARPHSGLGQLTPAAYAARLASAHDASRSESSDPIRA